MVNRKRDNFFLAKGFYFFYLWLLDLGIICMIYKKAIYIFLKNLRCLLLKENIILILNNEFRSKYLISDIFVIIVSVGTR